MKRQYFGQRVAAGVSAWFVIAVILASCGTPPQKVVIPPADDGDRAPGPPTIRYVGSSTIGNFIREAATAYPHAKLEMDTTAESLGGERLILQGKADLAGCATEPHEEIRDAGIHTTLIGTDVIAVIVNPSNLIKGLSTEQLRAIYTGKVRNWSELGGRDRNIIPLIMRPESATHTEFRHTVLEGEEYVDCRVVSPDSRMALEVESDPGSIGMVSYAFLCLGGEVRVLIVNGEGPLPGNYDYPILRPLYLLWRSGDPAIERFIAWTGTSAGQEVVDRCFGSLPAAVRDKWRSPLPVSPAPE